MLKGLGRRGKGLRKEGKQEIEKEIKLRGRKEKDWGREELGKERKRRDWGREGED